MCRTSSNKYIVNGEEILIDSNELSKEAAEVLEKCNVNQLDAYYIRKNIHNISKSFDKLSESIEERIQELTARVGVQEKALEESLLRDMDCKAKEIPTIASKVVHEIVNGKFGNIANELKTIKDNQSDAASLIITHKDEQTVLHNALLEKLDYVGNRTIFGWIKHNFETRPLQTLAVAVSASVVGFLYVMASLQIKSFSDMWNFIQGWFH